MQPGDAVCRFPFGRSVGVGVAPGFRPTNPCEAVWINLEKSALSVVFLPGPPVYNWRFSFYFSIRETLSNGSFSRCYLGVGCLYSDPGHPRVGSNRIATPDADRASRKRCPDIRVTSIKWVQASTVDRVRPLQRTQTLGKPGPAEPSHDSPDDACRRATVGEQPFARVYDAQRDPTRDSGRDDNHVPGWLDCIQALRRMIARLNG